MSHRARQRTAAVATAALLALAGLAGCTAGQGAQGDPELGGSTGATPAGGATTAEAGIAVDLTYFGYAGIVCDLDDPFDPDATTDYSAEVAGFTNANQVCVTGDMAVLADRLREAARLYTPVFYVEPVFFEVTGSGGRLHPDAETLWAMVRESITASGMDPAGLIFYLADEPGLRGLTEADLDAAAALIRGDYPGARLLVIDAFLGVDGPQVPAVVDLWGFNAYAIHDPGAEPLYTDYLDRAAAQLREGQSLVLVMDASYTPVHAAAGLSEADMADVARGYERLARSRTDVSMLLAYTWAGGIDGLDERGVRDLPDVVAQAHREIGLGITGE